MSYPVNNTSDKYDGLSDLEITSSSANIIGHKEEENHVSKTSSSLSQPFPGDFKPTDISPSLYQAGIL